MTVAAALREASHAHAGRDALWVAGRTVSYAELSRWSQALDGHLGDCAGVVAVIGNRRLPTYAAIFSCLAGGRTYVPINPAWPVDRIARILAMARPDAVLLGEGCSPELVAAITGAHGCPPVARMTVDGDALRAEPIAHGAPAGPRAYSADGLAYIMFTSGSTGVPKGVPVSAANLAAYVRNLSQLVPFDETDRVVQTVEITFDLSVHDMALAWTAGAMLAVVPEASASLGPRFVRQLRLTSWLSVPSSAAQAQNLGLLAPGAMPSLRSSFFCGEALPVGVAEAWRAAAPQARLFNIYGPTEATIAFSAFEFTGRTLEGAVVPLGWPIGDERMMLGDADELLLSGDQVFAGYLANPEKSAEALIEMEGRRWYRTGDRAGYDEDLGFLFRGRLDSQIKLRGYRVELGDIEAALRDASGSALVAAVPRDEIAPSTFNTVTGFVCGNAVDDAMLSTQLRERLPPYMVPDRIVVLDAMPRNSNDKIDRLALARMLNEG